MPRFNVKHPVTGEWACFSTIPDDFITCFMPKDEYEKWRKAQYGTHACLYPAEQCNTMTVDEVIADMTIYHKKEYVDAVIKKYALRG